MTQAEQFFYDNAGYSYNPQAETPEQGRLRCAVAMAQAEQYARDHGWYAYWEQDDYGCSGCECGSDECACSAGEQHETLVCLLLNSEEHATGRIKPEHVLASLGGICGATRDYRRVIEAELAIEGMHFAQSSELEMEAC